MASSGAAPAAASEFCFVVPKCASGTTIKLTAPDGVCLQLKLPDTVYPGDEMHMHKGENARWGIKHVVRGDGDQEDDSAKEAYTMAKSQDRAGWRLEVEIARDLAGPDVVRIELRTTKGPILLRIVPSWAPLGVERFLRMVDDGFYSDIAIYRAVPDFVVQFGIVRDRTRTDRYQPLLDDTPCGIPIEEGSVAFAACSSKARRYVLCLFLGDCRHALGRNSWETPIGKVEAGSLDTLHSVFTGYGDMPQCNGRGPDPCKLEDLGNEYITTDFPKCDFVVRASRV